MGFVKYLTGAALADGGGMQVLQEACICREASGSDIQVILAAVFAQHGELQHRLAIEIGEWFQNHLVPMIKKNGTDSLINVCIEGLGDKGFSEECKTAEFVCAIFAGDAAALFKNGSSVNIYSIEELFGKPIVVPMEPGDAGIMVEPETGGALVIADADLTSDKFFTGQIGSAVSSVTDENELERVTREIVEIEAMECNSLIIIRFT